MIEEQLAGKFRDPRLESLDATTKVILIRYFVQNDAIEEIAADLGISQRTVQKHIARAVFLLIRMKGEEQE